MAEAIQWIDPDGVFTTLDVEWEVKGRFMPPIETKVDQVPGQAGGIPRSTRHGVREFLVMVWQSAGSDAALRTALRNFVRTMDPTRGSGKLRVTSPLGDQREITCQYKAGLDLDETLGDNSGPDYQKIPLAFTAFDPYWYAVSPIAESFTIGTQPLFFPLFPLRLSSSQVAVEDTLVNGGDIETWPVWTVTGPGSVIKLINLTTGEKIDLQTNTLGAGEVLTIDTRENVKTLTLQNGDNLFEWLSIDSSLWSLRYGNTLMHLEMSGATAASGLSVSYFPRYLSP